MGLVWGEGWGMSKRLPGRGVEAQGVNDTGVMVIVEPKHTTRAH